MIKTNKKVITTGDFNVHFNKSDLDIVRLVSLMFSHGLKQTFQNTKLNTSVENLTEFTSKVVNLHISDHEGLLLSAPCELGRVTGTRRINYRSVTDESLFC